MSARVLRISPDLALPRDTVTNTMVIYGGRGMGKSNLGAVICEECDRAGLRFSVMDPMGVFWGLRHSKDGKGPGIEVLILGGTHGDPPIEPTGGAVVADLVVDEDVNVVIDISRRPNGKMWSLGERIRFVTDYTIRLYERQGERPRPLLQIYDEAGRWVPQMIPHGAVDIAKCVGAIERLVEEGRNVGVGVGLITQRSARMNKSVSELCEAMIAFRTVGPRSIAAILDWFGEHVEKSRWNELVVQLRSLPRGTALVVSPGWLEFEGKVQIRERETFDSSATPEKGKERRASGPGAKPDLARYQARMAETVEKAKSEDPRELQKRVKQLEADLKKAATSAPAKTVGKKVVDQDAIARAVERARRTSQLAIDRALASLERTATVTTRHVDAAVSAMQDLRDQLTALRGTAPKAPDSAVVPTPIATRTLPPAPRPLVERVVARAVTRDKSADTNGAISRVQQRILDTIRAFELLGIDQPDRVNVAAWCGYHQNAKSFSNALGASRSAGLVWYPDGGKLALTDEGRALASDDAPITSLEELHAKWFERLSGVERRILEAAMAHRDGVDRDELAAEVEYHPNAKSFSNSLGRLRSLGLITKSGPVKPTSTLFPEALV